MDDKPKRLKVDGVSSLKTGEAVYPAHSKELILRVFISFSSFWFFFFLSLQPQQQQQHIICLYVSYTDYS